MKWKAAINVLCVFFVIVATLRFFIDCIAVIGQTVRRIKKRREAANKT